VGCELPPDVFVATGIAPGDGSLGGGFNATDGAARCPSLGSGEFFAISSAVTGGTTESRAGVAFS
jgi:hypothetical protein